MQEKSEKVLANFHNLIQSRDMPKQKQKPKMLTNAQLREKIRAGQDFKVGTISERKRALMIASVLDIEIITRESDEGGFRIFIPSDVPN